MTGLAQTGLGGIDHVETEEAARARLSLSEFIRQAWSVIEPGTPYIHGRHIDAICEHLEAVSRGEIKRLIINMPPRHMKSIAVSVCWPCWEWIERPERRWLFASYAQGLSTRDSLKCRRIILSPWYRKNWGHVFGLAGDQNAKTRFENTRSGYRLATSVGGLGTGEGGDRIVVDDPHNVLEAESEKVRQATLDWWDQTMSTRVNDPETGAMVVVAQRVHENDLSGHLLRESNYELLCLPARYEGEKNRTSLGWEDPRTEVGDLLWPQRFNERAIRDLEASLGSYGAAGQLQQRPAPAGGGIFKLEWWRYFSEPPRFSRVIQSWDTAFKTGAGNSFSVGQTWGVGKNGFYLLDQVRQKLEFPELKQAVRAFYNKHLPSVVLVEDKASGQSIVQALLRETRIPIKAVTITEGDKELRGHTVSPSIEAGRVFLPRDAEWLSDFLDETASFPRGAFNDQVDAMTQALNYLLSAKRRVKPGQVYY